MEEQEQDDAFDSLVAKMHEVVEIYQLELSKRLDALDNLIKFYKKGLEEIIESMHIEHAKAEEKTKQIEAEAEKLLKGYEEREEKIIKIYEETIKQNKAVLEQNEKAFALNLERGKLLENLILDYNQKSHDLQMEIMKFNKKVLGVRD